MNINHKQVSTLKSFYGVELKGNETFDELLEIEKRVNGKRYIQTKFSPFDKSVKTYNDIFRYETEDERRERLARDKANIQRVDAQIYKYKK
jgi:mevalonate kinase